MSVGISGVGGANGPHVVSGASSVAAPPATKMANLFDKIDTSGAGSITQGQFNQAFKTLNPPGVFKKAGADAVFNTLNPSGTGSVSKPDFVQGMAGLMRSLRGAPVSSAAATSSATSPAGTLASSLQSLNQIGNASAAAESDGLGSALDVIG